MAKKTKKYNKPIPKIEKKAVRVPVVSPDGVALMPTTPVRARKWIESKKAVGKRNSVGVFYVQLVSEPSGYATQKIVAGVDRGKNFTGIAFQSKLATIALFHAVLPGFYQAGKSSKNKKGESSKRKTKYDRKAVTDKMSKRSQLRRTRRGRRVKRHERGDRKAVVPHKVRNHRQARFSNRRSSKIAPSIKSNREMELRLLCEVAKILPISEIRDEDCGGSTEKVGKGISPVAVGEKWFRKQAAEIAPVVLVSSWDTGKYRTYLGIEKDKNDKSRQTRETHANDAIAIATSGFIEYKEFHTHNERGYHWIGDCQSTQAPFIVITRPQLFRRKLNEEQYSEGGSGVFKRLGGTITPFGFRCGDYVEATKSGKTVRGWVGGYLNTKNGKKVGIYDHNWKRHGQFVVSQVKYLARSSRLCVLYSPEHVYLAP